MAVKLKRLGEQVVVITGASSGIGLATAREVAKRGAKLVLASRNKAALDKICNELGADAIGVECDVADAYAVQQVADRAIREFGRIDTWINNAGVSVYGKLWEVPLEEKKRLFDTNFWGVVHGCRSAVKAMRESGGAIINIGSVLSERAVPLQGVYSASKHAVKAYTDALRMEIETEGWPIVVTLVKPAAISTPYTEHAVNHMDHHPKHVPPIYQPEVVARAIASCCENRGALRGHIRGTSAATSAVLHPLAATLIAGGLGLAVASVMEYFGSVKTATRRSDRTAAPRYDEHMIH